MHAIMAHLFSKSEGLRSRLSFLNQVITKSVNTLSLIIQVCEILWLFYNTPSSNLLKKLKAVFLSCFYFYLVFVQACQIYYQSQPIYIHNYKQYVLDAYYCTIRQDYFYQFSELLLNYIRILDISQKEILTACDFQ